MKSLLRKIYAYRAIDDLILLYPLYSLMFADRGLSVFEISTLLILWSAVSIMAEVPSGVLADKYSRKNLLAIAQVIRAVGYGFWLFMPTYLGFAIGFVLWGLGGALTSGTFQALVFDELKAAGKQKLYVKVMGRAESLALVANFTATALAAAGILLGYSFVIVVSIATVLISGLIAFSLPDTRRVEETSDSKYFVMLRAGILQAVKTPAILKIILLAGVMACIYGSLEEYVPLFVHETGANVSLSSLIVAMTVAAAALASFMAFKYERLRNSTFMVLLAICGVALVSAASFGGVAAWVLVVGYTFLVKLLNVVFDGKLQHAIEDGSLRATVTSVNGFVAEVMSVGLYLVYGLIAATMGNAGAFKWVGFGIIAVALLYLVAAPRLASKTNFEVEALKG